MAELRQALSFLRQKKATDTAGTLPSPAPTEKDKSPATSLQTHDVTDDLEDYDEIFKNCDMFDFSPINISDRVDDTPPILSSPTHSKSRAVSQTDWSLSSQPLSKRPLLETTSQTTKTNSITRPLTTPSPSEIILTPTTASLPKRMTTPSVSRLNTPTVPRTGVQATPTRVVRKFPGPAGCLPPLDSVKRLDDTSTASVVSSGGTPASTPLRKSHVSVIYDYSDHQFDDFNQSSGPWAIMRSELDVNDPLTSAILNANIASIIRQASKKELPNGKVPHLCALVKSIVTSTKSATALLQDPSGEMHAAVHILVMEEYKDEFVEGSVAILRQVSVFSPSSRKHYLNVTLDNIVRIYPPQQSTNASSTSTRNLISLSRIEEDHQQKENQSASLLFGITSKTNNSDMTSSSNHSAINHFRNNNDTSNERIVSISTIAGGSITQHSNTVTNSDSHIPTAPNQVHQNQTPSDIEEDFDSYFEDIDISLLDF
ncbi:PREDICTED: endochitinase A-like [Amphimedon queenslandica]|uniref:Homologous recombination OB-fold protein OB-fold domain-containing protein n=1 Tax=Amphimedon queenslandica TaxID=400682 RepID=A0A1X7V084_AMPQE|nr:PREDICTED: endochitinase A-like [Amphimedon queenslandica]|eukprot:XP_019851238.1 PREDICTED: endochitinase A-like [Amphimedon queenslandica]